MIAKLGKIDPNGRYTPKQTWWMLGISKTALYAYDKKGFIRHELLPQNGRRVYRGREIIEFHEATIKI